MLLPFGVTQYFEDVCRVAGDGLAADVGVGGHGDPGVAEEVAGFACGQFVGQERGDGRPEGVGGEPVAELVTLAEGTPVTAHVGGFPEPV
jgi:hypothetical protein